MTKSICLSVAMSAAAFCATARAADGGVLPSEYQRVSYVEATGNQWVQTDYVPTGDAEYDFVVSLDSLQGTYGVFCARSNDPTAGRAAFLYDYGLRWDYGVTNSYSEVRDTNAEKDVPILVSIRKNEVYVDGVKSNVSKSKPASFDKNNALVLFALYSTDIGVKPAASNIVNKGRMKLHSFTVREAGVVKLDLVPCFRKSDGCVGMYDRVSEMFLTTPSDALVNGPSVDSDAGLDEAVVVVSSDCTSSDSEVKLRMNSLRTVAPGVPVAVTADAVMDFLAGCARSPIAWTLVSASAGEAPTICRSDGAHNRICSFTSQTGARYLLKWHYVTTTMAPSAYWLGSGYERLKSVTTDGSQHLVTDYTPKGNTSIEVKMSRPNANATQAIYCSRGTVSTVNTFTLFLIDGGRLRWDYGATDSVDITQTLAAPAAAFLFSNVRNKAYVDGAETILSKSAYSEYTAGNRLVLFASYGKPSDEEPADFSNGASIRLYAFRVSEDGQPKMDLVPCRRTADGAIGLYDTVKGEFHVPAGNDLEYESFGKSEVEENDLPPEYAKIGGVEATGSQYVLTDYRPNGNSCLKMKMTLKSKETQALFCSRGATAPQDPYSLFLYNGGLRWDYEAVDTTNIHGCETGKQLTITSTRHLLDVDGTQSHISKSEAKNYEAGNRLVLFAAYGTDLPGEPTGFSTFAKVVLHEFEITEGGALKLRLVPCCRLSDKVVGLYDTVAGKFHEPGGGALRGVSGIIGLEVAGTGLGELGEPTLPYGVTEGVVAGDSFVCAAPERVKTADGWAVCRGYLLETNGVDGLWYDWKGGKETSFVYEHPAGTPARLSWNWRKKSSGMCLLVR